MRFDPDFSRLPLREYLRILKNQTLLPSRKPLLDNVDARFDALEACGITNLAQLLAALSTPAKLGALEARTGVPAGYLTLLRREAGALKPKSVPLQAFRDADPARVEALLTQGITTSKAYLELGQEPDGVLHALCGLTRINGVGPGAARMLYEAGYRSPADVAAADAAVMLQHIAEANHAHRYYQGTLGLKDMQFCVDMAVLLLRVSQQ